MNIKPRLAFLGLGWIGTRRLEALTQADLAEIVALVDPCEKALPKAAGFAPKAAFYSNLRELLEGMETGLDGLIIATPSAIHAAQAITALEKKIAVFCQKPLGRNA